MADPTEEFFEKVSRSPAENISVLASGRIRFDLEHDLRTEHWLATIDPPEVRISRENLPADCVVHAGKGLFDRIISGDDNYFAAELRGELTIEGEPSLLVNFARLFSGPAGALHPTAVRRKEEPCP
ncbi:SCP2 sterol-binding domain-containing protein [Micromonospora sp. WMMD1102]|uniref:SCP2 sterol-binding domain-containing protein n=1 Tax=Micromonospora sp. WMMD1102 TaxID=3016105 RepID=UPI00241585C6|nr:SCP2 sterol-binding domain-containing protein [Micromonospora sp. WMMD1102]MDG4790629.1 SCP2 sterol-binding domain-containing protein [Micromonospora sp. WMMD1102]